MVRDVERFVGKYVSLEFGRTNPLTGQVEYTQFSFVRAKYMSKAVFVCVKHVKV